jgi:hypothetical protein
MASESQQKVIEYKRMLIQDMLDTFSERAHEVFAKIWGTVDQVPEHDLDQCIALCERTRASMQRSDGDS